MTVPAPGPLTYSYSEDGVTTIFAYPVRFIEAQELVVIRTVDGIATTLTMGVDYTVSGEGNPAGGSITRTAATNGGTITIYRDTTWKQLVDLEDKQRNPAQAVEDQLDRLTMAGQDARAKIGTLQDKTSDLDDAVARAEAAKDDAEDAKGDAEAAQAAAEAAQAAAEAAAAGVNLPAVEEGDAGKVLVVDDSEDGYRLAPDPLNSDNIQFLGRGVDAVSRSVQTAIRDRFACVSDYGIGAHGFEDALRRAVDAQKPPFTPEVLLVPRGYHTIEGDTVFINVQGLVLQGMGDRSTYIQNALPDKPAIQFGNDAPVGSGTYGMGIRNILFGAANGVETVFPNCGLRVSGVSYFTCRDVSSGVIHPGYRLYDGIKFISSHMIQATNVSVYQSKRDGILCADIASLRLLFCESKANGQDGLHIEGVEGFSGNAFSSYANHRYGVGFFKHSSRRNKNNKLHQFSMDTSGSNNWFAEDLSVTILTDCWGATQRDDSENLTASGFYFHGPDVFGLQFNGGRATNNNGSGVRLAATSGGAPRDILFNGFDFGTDEIEAQSNGRGGVVGAGLAAAPECTGIRVQNGRSVGNLTGAFANVDGIELIQNVKGYVNSRRMSVTDTTDASGDLTFDHGMDETPTTVICAFEGTTALSAQATSKTSTQVTVRVFDASGAAVANTSVTFVASLAGARAAS